ncbi:efflux RND transporter periplasmic adaptor subunit [Paracoccus limosus]|uniref:Efflux RND transporter periplasmic adaptor subunit n=1 Tax=Paracoccus limosus TaxID=913252 RepID=A0A844H902_9RHOB|nr:efflux RND transporter periplasmic adaptor subunit [Paracoccus limosus]MTH36374.1 efflux RND transporter periplasmic adaptor subunit [Paracoccus limosus]
MTPRPLKPLALAAFLAFGLLSASVGAAQETEAVRLTVAVLAPERVVLRDEFPGRVAALRRVEIRPQVGRLILERPVDEGARVAAGDVLFRIDPAPLQAELATAEAALARARAAETHARRALERSDALLTRNATSAERNEIARNDLALAGAGLAEAQALVERRRLDLGYATLRAPVAGYVAAGLADIGGLAVPGAERALAVVQDLDRVYVDLRLPAARLDAVQAAAAQGLGEVEILTDGGRAYPQPGQLRFSDVIVDPGTGNVSVRVEVDNPDMALLPGMFLRARLPRGVLPAALLVPEDAVLRNGGGGAQVVVVSDKNQAMRRDVVLGDAVGDRVVVASGLQPGERVAIRGQDRVPEGVPVAVTLAAVPEMTTAATEPALSVAGH